MDSLELRSWPTVYGLNEERATAPEAQRVSCAPLSGTVTSAALLQQRQNKSFRLS